MKAGHFIFTLALLGAVLTLQSCRRNSCDVWDDTKSAGRHLQRGVRALTGQHGDSRQVRCRDEFECVEDQNSYPEGNFQDCDYQDQFSEGDYSNSGYQDTYSYPQESSYSSASQPPEPEFVPLQDQANGPLNSNMMNRPSQNAPGEWGSTLPGIQAFRDPNTIPQLARIFQPIYFDYDNSLVKGKQNFQTLHAIAEHMRNRPRLYLFIEGHTDERGAQAYNVALGARRSNAVRNLLIEEGVNPDNIFTISYGKERPVVLEQHEEGWARNRRAEFKIYEH